jgi:hypothetical protein
VCGACAAVKATTTRSLSLLLRGKLQLHSFS